MMPVIHCSVGNISLFHIGCFRPSREIQTRRFRGSEKYSRVAQSSHRRLVLPQPAFHLISIHKRRSWSSAHRPRTLSSAAVDTDVTVEDPNPSPSGETSDESSETGPATGEASEKAEGTATATSTPKLGHNIRKSEMPPVKDEDLVPGASFTGMVRSIKPFGVFVDFGAFTEGLVHISRASDGYVKDISSLFTIGQEVTVRIVEANKETGRISLTMRSGGDYVKTKKETSKDASGGRNAAAAATRSSPRTQTRERVEANKVDESKYVRGQVLTGTVKSTTKSGTFVSFPGGEEGFLPREEEPVALFTLIGHSVLEVGQEINVKVLKVSRGQLTLTMKESEDNDSDDLAALNMELKKEQSKGTNAFALAFRRNKEISAFLDQMEKTKTLETQVAAVASVDSEIGTDVCSDQTEDKEREVGKVESLEIDSSVAITEEAIDDSTVDDKLVEPSAADSATEAEGKEEDISSAEAAIAAVEEGVSKDEESEDLSASSSSVTSDIPTTDVVNIEEEAAQEDEGSLQTLNVSSPDSAVSEISSQEATEDSTDATDTADDQTVQSDSPPSVGVELSSNGAPDTASVSPVSEAEDKQAESEESSVVEEVPVTVSSKSENEPTNGSVEKEPAVVAEEVASTKTTGAEVAAAGADQASATTGTISPALVKQLREATGAGMMDCKKALAESGGDLAKAQEFLRKKGLASADKRAGRATAEGRIGSYIHDSRIGVLVEVNCETDFVSRGDIFKELVEDLAMQVAACPQVTYISIDDVPEEVTNKEKELEMQREDILSKPEQIRPKIVEGRVRKRLGEFALLEQPYIKNDKVTINDWLKQTIATIGENMKVKRFVRYNLGEGLEKKSQDFAAEVAAQTAAKPPQATPPKDEKPAETTEAAEKKPTVAVSAALVKQLREETGAGMMDCKKALTESEGDLQKAQEYLRKKGLSSADKKSSRLAAEGLIASYIHDSRIGCLIEVNSETDFVARNEKFKEMVNDLAMQVVACPQVEYVSIEDIPESVVSKEKEIEMQRDDLQSKPENIREKIVEGRISKRLGVMALLEQPFIKDDSKMVKDLVKETIAALGENIKVRRFVRYTLGEN